MPDGQQRERELNRFWNALVDAGAEDADFALDREETEPVRQLHRLADLATGDATVQAAWPGALARIKGAGERDTAGRAGEPGFAPNGRGEAGLVRETPARRRIRGRSRGWEWVQSAAAVLLTIGLAAGYLAFWQSRNARPEPRTWQPAAVIATLPEGYSEQILLEATFGGDELPPDAREGVFYRLTMPPGGSVASLTAMICNCAEGPVETGVGTELVESGAYSVRHGAPIGVERGGRPSTDEDIPAGEQVSLDPGDVAIYRDYTPTGEFRNTGDESAVVIGFAIIGWKDSPRDQSGPHPAMPPGVRVEILTDAIPSDWEEFPAGPLTVTLRRVTLPAGTVLPPYTPTGLEAIAVESGGIGLGFVRQGETEPVAPLLHRLEGTTSTFVKPSRGVRRVIEASDDEPSELLVLTVEPAGQLAGLLAP